LGIKNKHISIAILLLAFIWLNLSSPFGTTMWTHCPDYIPDIILTGEQILGYTYSGGIHDKFIAFGPMIKIREPTTTVMLDYPRGVTGPSEVSICTFIFAGNSIGLVYLIWLGLAVRRAHTYN